MRIVNYLVGLGLMLGAAFFLWEEYKHPPVATSHLLIHLGVVLVGLVVMGYADEIADGVKRIGAAAKDYLPTRKP